MTDRLSTGNGRFRLNDCVVDGNALAIIRDGQSFPLEPRAFRVLQYLAERPGQLVTIDALMDAHWDGAVVTPNAVTRVIAQIRKALGDDARNPRFIETISRTGYRCVASVEPENEGTTSAEPAASSSPMKIAAAAAVVIIAVLFVVLMQRNEVELPAVAILPIENLTGDEDVDYIAIGMADEIIHSLTKFEDVEVRTRHQSFSLVEQGLSHADIADQLDVELLVTGTVRRTGTKLRFSAQLVNINDSTTLWSDIIEQGRFEIFEGQDMISRAVALAIGNQYGMLVNLDKSDSDASTRPNPDAYDHYLRGRYVWHRRGSQPLQPALDAFREAVRIDPDFARGWSALATAYLTYPNYSPAGRATWHLAKPAAEKAISLDQTIGEAYAVLATFEKADLRWQSAEALFVEGVKRSPSDPTAQLWYSEFLMTVGRTEEGRIRLLKTIALDPTYSVPKVALGFAEIANGNPDAAIELFESNWNLGMTTPLVAGGAMIAHVVAGNLNAARRWGALYASDEATDAIVQRFLNEIPGTADEQLINDIVNHFTNRPDYAISIWMLGYLSSSKHAIGMLNARLDNGFHVEIRPLWTVDGLIRSPEFSVLAQRLGLTRYWSELDSPMPCDVMNGQLDCSEYSISSPDD